MTKMTFEQMAEVEGGGFLGWGWHTESKELFDSHPECGGGAGYVAHQSYDIFGIGTGFTRDRVIFLKSL